MGKNAKCRMISTLLGSYVNNRLKGEKANQVAKHLRACPSCQGIVDSLDLVLHASPMPRPDLWPILQSRLAVSKEDNQVRLMFPPFTWQTAVALAVVVCILAVAPDPWRLLIAIGII